mmetsp:Transcript_23295/g.58941  ORF Transcript_23295/g.58941 Transcript_23295/m.58941 type:complete len:499 (-) Transcript_23295:1410-2906(-)
MPLPPVPPPVLPKAACFAVGVHNHWTQFYEHYHWLPEYLHTREEELEVQHAQEGSQGQGSAPSAPPPATIYETMSALFSPAGRTVSESAVRGVVARAPASSASSSVVLDLLGSRPVFSEHVLSNELFDFTYRNHIFRMHNREGNVVVFFPHASLMGTSSSAPSSATGTTASPPSYPEEQEAAEVGTSSSTPRRRVIFFEKEDFTSDQKTLLHDPHTEVETVGVASSSTTSSAGPDEQGPKTPEQMQKMKGAEQFVDHCHLHEFDYYEQRTIYYDGDFLSDISTACSPRDHPENCFSASSASEDDPMALFSAASSASDASDGEDYYFYDKEIVRSDRSCSPASPPSHLLDPEFEFELSLKEEEAHGGIFGSSSSSTRTVVRRGAPDYEEDCRIKPSTNGAGSSCTTTNRAARGSCKSPRSPSGGVAGRAMTSSTSLDPTRQHWTLRNGRLEREEAWTITSGRGIGGNSSNVAPSGHQYSHLQPGVQGCRPLIICGMSRI